jgi:hypothetical protein
VRGSLRAVAVAGMVALTVSACGGSATSPTPGGGGNGGNGGNGGGGGVVVNTPPTLKSITASDTRVEVGTPITLTANVEDAETPVANLTYTWSIDTGGFTITLSGTGPSVTWTPAADTKTPADIVVTVAVTERYTSGSTQLENRATGTTTVHVNNSPKELAELSLRFLGDFANSRISPETCVSEFSDATPKCAGGKKDELADIRDNRHDYEMVGSTLRHTGLSIAANNLSATVHTFCSFTVKVIAKDPVDEVCLGGKCPLGSQGTSTGDCWTTNVFEQGRWWLCESHFTGLPSLMPQAAGQFTPTLFRRSRQY